MAEILRRVRTAARLCEHEHAGEYLRLTLDSAGDPQALQASIEGVHPEIEVISFGRALDIVKQVGSPENLEQRFGISRASGTRTVPTRVCQPKAASTSVIRSLSGPTARWMWLRHIMATLPIITNCAGNMSSVACASILRTIRKLLVFTSAKPCKRVQHSPRRLQHSVQFFDGSFSYLAATASEAWFRQRPFGFKPLIVAESEAYVAIATEEAALRAVCGAEVETWEPPAGTVQTWNVCQERQTRRAPGARGEWSPGT